MGVAAGVRQDGMGREELSAPELQCLMGRTGQVAAGRALREERSGAVRACSLDADQRGAQAWSGRRTCPGREHVEKAVLQDQAQGTAMTPIGLKESRLSPQTNR